WRRPDAKKGRPVARPPASSNLGKGAQVIALATLVRTFDTLPPTVPMAAMAATEISEAISTYSIAVAPRSFFISLRNMDSIIVSLGRPAQSGPSSGRRDPWGKPRRGRVRVTVPFVWTVSAVPPNKLTVRRKLFSRYSLVRHRCAATTGSAGAGARPRRGHGIRCGYGRSHGWPRTAFLPSAGGNQTATPGRQRHL